MRDLPLKIVRAHDPALAICADADVWHRYVLTREIEKLPPLPAGRAFTFFEFRRLGSRRMLRYVERGATDAEKWERAFMSGVTRVEGPLFEKGAWEPEGARSPDHEHMTEAERDEFAPLDIKDIGRWIYLVSDLPKDCVPRSEPLLGSAAAWDVSVSLCAAQSQSDAAKSSSPPKGG